jgi:hypothetical protein
MTPEIITVAGATAAYGLGLIAEHRAVSHAAETQARLLEAAGPALRQEATAEPLSRREQLTHWASRNLLAPLALTAAVAGGLEASAWTTAKTQTKALSALEVVVDRSGATNLSAHGQPVLGEINDIVGQLQGIKHATAQAEVAQYGGVIKTSLDQVKTIRAVGDAPLAAATGTALDNAAPKGAVVVVTYGNSVGTPDAILSKEPKAKSKVPVFVVNVEKAGSPHTAELRAVAHATHGQYWDASRSNVSQVTQAVQGAVSATHQEKPVEQPADWTDRIFGGIALAAAIGYFRKRRSYTLGKGPKGE